LAQINSLKAELDASLFQRSAKRGLERRWRIDEGSRGAFGSPKPEKRADAGAF